MTHAVIRGKVSSSGTNLTDRLEDLLTSDVFGRLNYLKPEYAIIPILKKIKNSKTGQQIDELSIDHEQEVNYQFWPRINSVEPDLFLRVPLLNGKQMAVLIECKHKSGKSPRVVKEENQTDLLELAKSDQLVREYLIVEDLKKQYSKAILLYITGHSVIPEEELKESAALVATLPDKTKNMFYETTYWIGWADIWNVLRAQSRLIEPGTQSGLILEDVVNLLSFHGYREFQEFPGARSEIMIGEDYAWTDRPINVAPTKPAPFGPETKSQIKVAPHKQENIKNAFSLVFDVYQEAAFLVKDLEKAVEGKGFRPANKATGHPTGNSYDRPEQWLATFSCRYWVEDNRPGKLMKKGPSILYLGCTVIYAIYGKAIEPLFTYGVLQGMDNPQAEFYHEWLWHVNHNEGGNFYYWRADEGKEYFSPPADNKPTAFYCRLQDNTYAWPKKGVVVTLPLTNISKPDDIKALADNMRWLWDKKADYFKLRDNSIE
jgi:hypothetical protein